MTSRPGYVRCIMHGHEKHKRTAWCGNTGTGGHFGAFLDIEHAAYNAKAGARLVVCRQCAAEVAKALDPANYNGSEWAAHHEGWKS